MFFFDLYPLDLLVEFALILHSKFILDKCCLHVSVFVCVFFKHSVTFVSSDIKENAWCVTL